MERFHPLLAIVLFGGYFCNGESMPRDEGISFMNNIFYQNEEILEHLKGQLEKITSLEDIQRTMMLNFQDMQRTMMLKFQDIDECQQGQHQCQSPKTSINIDGSYECQCTPPYIRDGESCKIDCKSPSLHLDGLGCITLIQTEMTWTEARAECKRLGQRLLEDLKVEHLSPLDLHFTSLRSSNSWIGFREKNWVTSGHSVASELVAVREGELEGGCGIIDMSRNNFGLWSVSCKLTYDVLCQAIP